MFFIIKYEANPKLNLSLPPKPNGNPSLELFFLSFSLGGALPKLWSGQVISIVYAFGMTIAIGTYTAQLTATNVDKGSRRSFEGFNDPLVSKSRYL